MRNEERNAVRQQYKNHVIYKAFKAPCEELAVKAKGFKFFAEDLFHECVMALDEISDKPDEAVFNFQCFWSEKYNDFKEQSDGKSGGDVVQAATMVTLGVLLCLNVCEFYHYRTLALSLVRQLQEHDPTYPSILNLFLNNIYRLGDEKFKQGVKEYMDGDKFFSDEIDELLLSLPPIQTDLTVKDGEGGFTTRQKLILLDVGFDIGFTSETTNVSAYSKIIAKIVGGNDGSIRTAMNRLKKVGYDGKSVKDDVKYLIEQVEPLSESFARKLKNQINDY